MNKTVYTAKDIRQWERLWFDKGNSSYGLMQQAALLMAHHIHTHIKPHACINVWCGIGNNGGDGLIIASHLSRYRHAVKVILTKSPTSTDAITALTDTQDSFQLISDIHANGVPIADVQIDALFGIGLNRPLGDDDQQLIEQFNTQAGLKIAIDIPSGLHADTGVAMPVCTKVHHTLCVIGLKIGLYGAISKSVVGHITLLPLIPPHHQIPPAATLIDTPPQSTKKNSNAHKGHFGSVMVIGGHANMGGAVILAGEAAMAVGAGRVTLMTCPNHHTAILSRSPNLMLSNINDDSELDKLSHMNAVCFGMGLGRDEWSVATFRRVLQQLLSKMSGRVVVLDADALWHLANHSPVPTLPPSWILTPHSAEAARLLGVSVETIEQDRVTAIRQLQAKYGGNWVLKGANTLILTKGESYICTLGNAGMATAGMGDVLSGMIAGLSAQSDNIKLTEAVALHAHAGDLLAAHGEYGISAQDMMNTIKQAINTQTPNQSHGQ